MNPGQETPTMNPITTHSAQPFRGSDMVVIEKRDAEGRLILFGPPHAQPPAEPMTFDDVYQMYFRATTFDGPSVGWAELRAWLNERGWVIRACTWLQEPEWQTKARAAGWQPGRRTR